ncbi:hypothetical protein CDD83_8941 [Cordyceps sp. RAO-2017]|nr:hypothetical protein CDD83_8941 [Cordyceps sp. RAO-2017]
MTALRVPVCTIRLDGAACTEVQRKALRINEAPSRKDAPTGPDRQWRRRRDRGRPARAVPGAYYPPTLPRPTGIGRHWPGTGGRPTGRVTWMDGLVLARRHARQQQKDEFELKHGGRK